MSFGQGTRGSNQAEALFPPMAEYVGHGCGDRSQRGRLDFCQQPRQAAPMQTHGCSGEDIPLLTNYFRVLKSKDWGLHQYSVAFDPPETEIFICKSIMRLNKDLIGNRFIFDGTLLYTPFRHSKEDENGAVVLAAVKKDGNQTRVHLRYIHFTEYGDPIYIQFYNLIVRKCMFGMGMEEVGRGFFDSKKAISFPALKMDLWPGYTTAIDHHESEELLLCVDLTHKVLRTEPVQIILHRMRDNYKGKEKAFQEYARKELKDSFVITTYNNASYRIVGIDFENNSNATFKTKSGEEITYVDYYRGKYKAKISQTDCLLHAIPTKKPLKYKDKANNEDFVVLIPELCVFTGLTDEMRANYSIMKELSKHLHMGPLKRVEEIRGFMERLMAKQELTAELETWGLHFETDLVGTLGRVLPREKIHFAQGTELPNNQRDWTAAFRKKRLLVPEALTKWMIIVTIKDALKVDDLVRTMQMVAGPLGVVINQPTIIKISEPKAHSYIRAIDDHFYENPQAFQLVFAILSNTNPAVYGAVKKRLAVDFGVSSQCFLSKNLTSKGIMSIATKVVVQMSTKIGGEPWTVDIRDWRDVMVVGIDSYKNITAVVATVSSTFTKYVSTVSSSKNNPNMVLGSDIEKCLVAFNQANMKLPKRIIIYRTGNSSYNTAQEKEGILSVIKYFYGRDNVELPKLVYVLVSKGVNTRLFADMGNGVVENPPPGTILDNDLPKLRTYQFFLIASSARQGTVAPCLFHVVHDDGGWNADQIQRFTFKMCHLYYNWSGTVSVPATLQYARKLAQMTAIAFGGDPAHHILTDRLFFL